MKFQFSILNFEFLIPTRPTRRWVGRGQFKIQNSKFKIFTGLSEYENHA
jgi:hypothetical protein